MSAIPSLPTKSTGKTLYVICEDGSPYSLHSDSNEAESYYNSLTQVFPRTSWEIQEFRMGYREGEDHRIWAGVGTVDLLERKVVDYHRAWVFPNMIWNKPIPRGRISRFLKIISRTTEEGPYTKEVAALLNGLNFTRSPDITDTQVFVS